MFSDILGINPNIAFSSWFCLSMTGYLNISFIICLANLIQHILLLANEHNICGNVFSKKNINKTVTFVW